MVALRKQARRRVRHSGAAKAIMRPWTCPGLRDAWGLVVDVVLFERLFSTAER
jgi:hypothetical protein